MISWMQKHHKFLVITIWIATISFIFTGATYGFKYGIKNNTIGRVGDIELTKDKFNMEYRNLYNRYASMFKDQFDEKQAKAMHLEEQVLNSMRAEAMILNLAKEFGIVVSNKEVAHQLTSIPAFQKNGVFNKSIYENFLNNNGVTAKSFETNIKNSLIIQKTFKLLNVKALKEEFDAIAIGFEVADKIKYITLSTDDMNVSIDEKKLKEYWEGIKGEFKTDKKYTLDIVWVDTKDKNITDNDIKKYYGENSFKYLDKDGKVIPLDKIKDKIIQEVKILKSKRKANKAYIAFKKEKIQKDEEITYSLYEPKIPSSVWKEIISKNIGDLIKPKVIGDKYAIIKIASIQEPRIKSFDEARESVILKYKDELSKDKLIKTSENKLKHIDGLNLKVSNFITLKNIEKQNLNLNREESIKFANKLFTSNKEKGIISIGNKVIVYKVLEQKLISIDKNDTDILHATTNKLKMESFESNLMNLLDKKYPVEFYK